ncbi:MAG: tRNA (adenosine(37)-N6)-dimethylallyltransferase MiaA [Candidatus Cryptobacteroides sp.]
MPRKLLIILGPTAVGKSDYAIEQALKYESPVISCDSRQIYREMCIGTAVPSPEQLRAVRHYFIQTHSVKEIYTAGKYEAEALKLIGELFEQGHETLVMAGGSGFYIDALCNGLDDFPDADPGIRAELTLRLRREGVEGLREELKRLDPQSYATIDISNGQRVVRALEVCLMTGRPFSSFKTAPAKKRDFEIEKIGLTRPRDVLYERIDRRVDAMIEEGLVEEARSLLPLRHLPALQTVGYRELFKWFDHQDGRQDEGFSNVPGGMFVTPSEWKDGPVTTLERAAELIRRNTRHYAKRQLSWWRRDDSIRWIDI